MMALTLRYATAAAIAAACARLWILDPPAPEQPSHGERAHAASIAAWPQTREPAMTASISLTPPRPGSADDPPGRLYARVMRERAHGDCEAVIHGFRLFMELYRTSAVAPFAEYWRGDCECRIGRHADAVASFDRVLADAGVPADLVAAALMRKAQSYEQLGQRSRARHTLELVVVQFPATEAAHAARRVLIETPFDRVRP